MEMPSKFIFISELKCYYQNETTNQQPLAQQESHIFTKLKRKNIGATSTKISVYSYLKLGGVWIRKKEGACHKDNLLVGGIKEPADPDRIS